MGESVSYTIPAKVLWAQISYFGFTGAVPFYLLFITEYSNQIRIRRRELYLLMIVPLLTIIAAWTNQWHHLLWSDFHWGTNAYNVLIYDHGIVYYLYVLFIFILAFWGFVLILRTIPKSQPPFRSQLHILALSGIFPMISGAMYVVHIDPLPGLDISSFGFLLTDIFLVLGLSYFQLLDLVPVAKNTLFKQFQDGMVIVDGKGRVVDINQKALELLHVKNNQVIGQEYQTVFPWKLELGKSRQATQISEFCLDPKEEVFIQVQFSPLVEKGLMDIGYLIVMRNISQSKQTEIQLKLANVNLLNQIEEIDHLRELLQEQATHDSLTNLHNRRLMDEVLNQFVMRSKRNQQPCSVLIMDIDHFKSINDDFGHQTGDEILVAIGKLILGNTRSTDFSCRLGGDEILMAMQKMSAEDAKKKAEEIRKKVEELKIDVGPHSLSVKTSIGVATYPDSAGTSDELVYWADQAMYRAKEKGGNTVVLALRVVK